MADDKRNLAANDFNSQPPPYAHPHIPPSGSQPPYTAQTQSYSHPQYGPQSQHVAQAQYAPPQPQYPSQPAVQNVTTSATSIVVNSNVGPHMPYVPDYMAWSIITMLCCCLPLGIVAIILSAMVRDYRYSGNHASARQMSRGALIVNIIATVAGIAVITALVIVAATGGFYVTSYYPYDY